MRWNDIRIRRSRRSAIAATALGLIATTSQLHSDPPTPAINSSLAAIAKGDYQSADDTIRDAAASSPAAYRDIGAAEATIPGRELRAISWLAAYLAAEPHAPDAAKIRDTITALNAKYRDKTLLLLECLAAAPITSTNPADLVPQWDNGPSHASEARDHALSELVTRWSAAADFDTARRVIGLIHWNGEKSDADTALVRAETAEATRLFQVGDTAGSAALITAAQKDADITFPGIYPDRDRPYCIAMAQLQIARDLTRTGNFDQARRAIELVHGNDINYLNADTQGSIATTLITLARAQTKSGDKAGARKTLAEAAGITSVIDQKGSPLKFQTLRDLADAQTDAGDLDAARAALITAVPLVVIYNDPDHSRLDIVVAQLKAGDKDGAQKTAALMTDLSLKAKALQAIATPPAPPKPGDIPFPPFPSQYLTDPPAEPAHVSADTAQWISLIELNLDAPCFTAFPDDSDPAAIANAIQHEPVRLARHAPVLDTVASLELVSRRLVDAQVAVDQLLKIQFGP